jgi:hypothetical protein
LAKNSRPLSEVVSRVQRTWPTPLALATRHEA